MKNFLLIAALAVCSTVASQVEACEVSIYVTPNSYELSDYFGNYEYSVTGVYNGEACTLSEWNNSYRFNVHGVNSQYSSITVTMRNADSTLARYVISIAKHTEKGCMATFTPRAIEESFTSMTIAPYSRR